MARTNEYRVKQEERYVRSKSRTRTDLNVKMILSYELCCFRTIIDRAIPVVDRGKGCK